MDIKPVPDMKEDLIKILDCLLKNVERKCETCRNCVDVDVCCFFTDAVIVYKHKDRKKSNSVKALVKVSICPHELVEG